eukprot:SAG22_NODE_493_length_9820_cov_53.085588_11_plen_48_part_00
MTKRGEGGGSRGARTAIRRSCSEFELPLWTACTPWIPPAPEASVWEA